MKPEIVYADYAAATPTDPAVTRTMIPYLEGFFGNPSSLHQFGRAASEVIERAKTDLAQFLNCESKEIYFTSGGTESNNLAILGLARANQTKGKHLITTEIEHPSILNACRSLEKDGYEVTYLPVDKNGLVNPEDLEKAIKKDTTLVSINLANSEIGIIQRIAELTKIARKHQVFFHTDACQATSFLKLDVNELGVDLLTLNSSKAYGPKGIGLLYVRNGTSIFPIFFGGGQQQSLRSGTENVAGIVGLAAAISVIAKRRATDTKNISQLRDLLEGLLAKNTKIKINVSRGNRLPNHLSVTLVDKTNIDLVKLLDEQGIAVSAGSACSSRSLSDSHVLKAIGLSSSEIQTTIRISLGRDTTKSDCQKIVSATTKLT